MKNLHQRAIVIIASVLIYSSDLSAQQMGSIDWQADPQRAAQMAAEQSKPVLLHFTADWCGPCQNQKRFVFSNPTVAHKVNQSVIPVLVDIDENRELAAELGVKNIPFDVFLTPNGDVISKRQSPAEAENFTSILGRLPAIDSAPRGGAMAKLADLKRALDPMSLPAGKRSGFGTNAPVALPFGVSKEAIDLARKSTLRDKLSFRNAKAKTFGMSTSQSDIQAAVDQLAKATQETEAAGPSPKSQFFSIPANRLEQPDVEQDPAINALHPQRAHEISQRQQFLSKPRADIAIPTQPANVQAERVLKNNFFQQTKNVEMKQADGIPGLQVSGMVDPRTGQAVAAYETGPSFARIKKPAVVQPPAAVARIMPRKETRIGAHSVTKPFAKQASLESSQAKVQVAQAKANIIANDSQAASSTTRSSFGNEAVQSDGKSNGESNPGTSSESNAESDFALSGKCPVTLVLESAWVDGDPRWGMVHRDRTYLFQSQEKLEQFKSNPDAFSPVLAGYDPVEFSDSGRFVDGKESHGVFMEKDDRQQVVLFSSKENRKIFQANPKKYMRSVRKALYTANAETVSSKR